MMSQAIFKNFEKTRVLIVGDVMIDRYIFGAAERISPEAPVPVVEVQDIQSRLGGSANVALNVKAQGGTPLLLSVCGDDEDGSLFLEMLKKEGISQGGMIKDKDRPTTVKTRVISRNQQLLRYDSESKAPLSQTIESKLLNIIKGQLQENKIDVILFQDYNKGVLSLGLIREILMLSILHEIPTTVDPKHENFYEYRGVTLFKPNLSEIQKNVSIPVDPSSADSLKAASIILRHELQYKYGLITLSSRGIFLDKGTEGVIVPTTPRIVADVCGAGDTVIAIASMCIANGVDIETLALLSNLAGGIVCEDLGVVPVNKEKLIAEYDKLRENLQDDLSKG